MNILFLRFAVFLCTMPFILNKPHRGTKLGPERKNRKYRVLLLDNCPLVCKGLSMLLDREPDFSTYWHGQSYREALLQVRIGRVDLVIVGLQIEKISIFDLIKDIRNMNPRIQVVVYGSCYTDVYATRVLGVGARAFVRKSEPTEVLLTAIRLALKGEVYKSPSNNSEQKPNVFGKIFSDLDAQLPSLTNRELEVFRMIGIGKTSPEMANEMGLGVKTVETYRGKIRKKLALRNNTELIQATFCWVQETMNY